MTEASTSRARPAVDTGGCQCGERTAAVPVSHSCSCDAKAAFKRLVACGQILFKGSYFGECERDDEGHCLPSGEAEEDQTRTSDNPEPPQITPRKRKLNTPLTKAKNGKEWLEQYVLGIEGASATERATEEVGGLPTDEIIKELTPYVPKESVVLYRYVDQEKGSGSSGQQLRSWTHSQEFAESFLETYEGRGKVIKKRFYPDEILIDTTLLPEQYQESTVSSQQEVIVAYGQLLKRMREARKPSTKTDQSVDLREKYRKDLSYLSETSGGALVRPPFKRFTKILKAPKLKGRWVTMPANGPGGGGTHVYIDNSGEIQKGPSRTVGREPNELPKDKPNKKSEKIELGPITEEARPKLSEDEESALEHYTASAWINDELRGLPLRPEATQYFTEERRNEVRRYLKSAFENVRPMTNPTLVYRGAGFDSAEDAEKFIRTMEEAASSGKGVKIPGYISTSKDESAAKEYIGDHGVFVRIKAKEGLDLNHYSAGDSRGELLLNHNSEFEVESIEEDESGRTVLTLSQISRR